MKVSERSHAELERVIGRKIAKADLPMVRLQLRTIEESAEWFVKETVRAIAKPFVEVVADHLMGKRPNE